MPLTEQQYKDLIVLQVGDDAAGTLAANIDTLWLAHDDTADLGLRALLTKRDAIDVMLGRVRGQVSFRALDGASVSLSDLSDHLQAMRAQVEAQIGSVGAGAVGGGALGDLTNTAPLQYYDANVLGPNARALRGDPRYRRGRP